MKKQKPINRSNLVAHSIGSIIIGIMSLETEAKSKGSFIRLKQDIIKHTSTFQKQLSKEQLEMLSRACYDSIIELDTSEAKLINPATIVESLAFTFEDEFLGFYDSNIIEVVSRYSFKSGETAKDSYLAAKEISKSIRKKIFDGLKEVKI